MDFTLDPEELPISDYSSISTWDAIVGINKKLKIKPEVYISNLELTLVKIKLIISHSLQPYSGILGCQPR